ncbi:MULTISPECIES: acyl-CoA dehydrogenase family protein [Dermacoccus]|uniref:Probable acyl-CoA dehydrogenase fadE25 n=1 Tax=Dermacoccus nishinomiyaensis TaxID=1274 RepID=A0A075JIW7_9MICO|nr:MULTISPECIES: acyl-CoA dehydrogenase family protein [Dermacoccus]HCQ18540.1 acyl-CoA dehydrogenase [Dermacoccus sp.]AIF41287.1 acyl-CoA dehydrogenase [Dermacoccus nishinomiyaensis]MCG7429522.1 acyl-CoA dehydrogenase family protein [Dermacoccus nishinomiyaensis]MCT1603321.1 acyl-CoA dehydrogenase family protein [Dermacoccus nishinomiyaensis]NHC31584.1 acyl-CoA dehydrogenase [Dermacoccus nishinomiyaensis]
MAANPDFDLYKISEEHEALREAIRPVCENKIAPHAADVDDKSRFPQEALDALIEAGMQAPHVDEQYGGMGIDALGTCIVIEEVARVCASSSLIPAVNKLGSMPVILGGGEEIKAKYLPKLASGEAMFSYGLSEREAGSDTASMKTKAKRDGDHYVLNGQKSWITNAGESEFYTVLAVTDPDGERGRNISAFVVEKSDEGFSFGEPERKLGIKGSPTRELHFDNCRIPADRIVGAEGEGLKIALRTLDHTRVTIGAQAVGIAQGALDYAVGYVKERQQFGKAIAEFQAIQFMLADMAMKVETARQMVYVAAAKSERQDADLSFFGAAAKCFASDVAMEVTTDAVQLLGGAGYVKDFPVERMMRDAKITQIYEGTNQIQRLVMGRAVLKGY